ncbi:GNAT family N-acetyltransferase [Streptomyces flavofungini]|uniref:GNAT family N-acetyltransferase n=1 Tax=Streptomyces flavofungini TaxID=68200 RepID=UPI0025B0E2C2|nr:GNAT family N-acetyltransferase [Streptomyces flavofungini]WJV51678.1 GNAT family N-acetyltransferase [Streptomyces flavofungini]
MPKIRTARRGDGKHVDRLGDLAMGSRPSLSQEGEPTARLIDAYGGEFPVSPFGKARAVVAEREAEGSVCGLAQVVPPARLIREYANEGRRAQRALSVWMAEIDLLAVDLDARGQGIGSALLGEAERWLENRGCRVVTAKIARGDFQVMRWYRRRGYSVAAQGESFWAWASGIDIKCNDGDDGYHLALKGLGGVSVRRAQIGERTYLTVGSRE